MGLVARADDLPFGWVREGDFIVPWLNSRMGVIVKLTIVLVLFVVIIGYCIGGYMHARARIRKGLPPLAYHRCLVGGRRQQPQPQTNWPPADGYYQPNGYAMHPMHAAAAPVYDPSRPPVYSSPPDGAAKVDLASQPTSRAPEANPAPDYSSAGAAHPHAR